MWFFIIGTILIAMGFSVIRTGNNKHLTVLTKTLASMGFVTFAIFASIVGGKDFSLGNSYLIFGAVWGLIGDIVLDVYYSTEDKNCLLMGFISFGIGHLGYIMSLSNIMANLSLPFSVMNYLYTALLSGRFTLIIFFGS